MDKTRTKEILSYYKIPTAKFQLFKSPNDPLDKNLRFPLFVKPNTEGSSRGITGKSLVNNEKELRETAASIIKKYHQPALVEEFLDGREFTVSLIGNPSEIMPIVEITFDNLPEGVPKFDCYDVKWVWDSPDSEVETVICPAKIDKKLEDMIKRTALDTFQALECLDFGRIDMRLDRNGVPNVIDVNPIAGLIPDPKENSRFPKACYTAGMTYNQIILKIIESALKRIGK
ncbi:MAG: D-alanine--D-alanine ligase [Candidatus Aenigmarchaeota archaeon]|nr:D-alanine--D-alanine ligase [Candidatus Aenigmarchaeota archaeon]